MTIKTDRIYTSEIHINKTLTEHKRVAYKYFCCVYLTLLEVESIPASPVLVTKEQNYSH